MSPRSANSPNGTTAMTSSAEMAVTKRPAGSVRSATSELATTSGGDQPWTWAAARDPDAEPEEKRRQRGDEIAAAHVIEMSRGERGDLEDEQSDVRCSDREERAHGRFALSPPSGLHCQGRGREQRKPEHHQVERSGVPEDLSERARRGRCPVRNRSVGAEEIGLAGRREYPQGDRREADESEQRNEPAEDLERAPEPAEQPGGDDQHRKQHERLQPHRRGEAEQQQERALAHERRLFEHAGESQERRNHQRIEERFGHEQAAVPERGRQHGERCRRESPTRASDRLSPEVDGNRDHGDRESLERLGYRHAASELADSQRQADECGGEQAVVRNGRIPDGQRARLPERLPDKPVDHLVRRDPGHVERAGSREAHDRREEHDRAHGERRRRLRPRLVSPVSQGGYTTPQPFKPVQ